MRKFMEVTDKILELHKQGISAYQISKKLGLSKNYASRALKKAGIDISNKQHKREDRLVDYKTEIIKMYESGISSYEIAKLFNCQDSSIVRSLQRWDIELRPLKRIGVQEDFFNIIDTEHKAYILGFLMADGSNDVVRGEVRLQITDADILLEMSRSLKYLGNISIIEPRIEGHLKQYKLSICSKIISEALTKLGCTTGKTYHAKFPTCEQVPDYFIRHFIRGLSDGDGTITHSTGKNNWSSRIVGTKDICEGLKKCIFEQINISSSVCPVNISQHHTTYAFTVGGKYNLKKYLDWIYKDCSIKLERKYLKYREFLQGENNG